MTMCEQAPKPRWRDPLTARTLHNMGEWYLWFGKVTLLATLVWIVILLAAEHAG